MSWVYIEKAKKKPKSETPIHAIADSSVADVERSVLGFFERNRKNVNVDEVEGLLGSTSKRNVQSKLVADSLDLVSQAKVNQKQRTIYRKSAKFWQTQYPELKGLKFDPGTKESQRFLNKIVSDRNENLNRQSRKTIRRITMQAKNLGFSDRDTARLIKNSVSLNQVQARNLLNLQLKMKADGLSKREFNKRTTQFIEEESKKRAHTIARNESVDIINESLLDSFEQADKQGLLSVSDYDKEWDAIIDLKTSEICNRLHKQRVDFNSKFVDPAGAFGPFERPRAHVNCRATLRIIKKGVKS